MFYYNFAIQFEAFKNGLEASVKYPEVAKLCLVSKTVKKSIFKNLDLRPLYTKVANVQNNIQKVPETRSNINIGT